jgi:hypothetical protein
MNEVGNKVSLHAIGTENTLVDPHITHYVGLSLIIGFTSMMMID